MLTLLIILLLIVLLDGASYFWGVDSRDNIDSGEWERRRHYDEQKAMQGGQSIDYVPPARPFAKRPVR